MNNLKTFITYGIFPIVFISTMTGSFYAMQYGYKAFAIIASVSLLTAVIIHFCEKINPHFKYWSIPQNDVKTDAIHVAVSMGIIPQVLDGLLSAVLLVVALKLTTVLGFAVWPHDWHLGFQLILALLISQFGTYWSHRLMHEVPLLWRLHATHHSPKRLYWLNAGRFHPLDTIVGSSISLMPLLILGAGDEVFVLQTVWVSVHGMFQHCNIHLKLGLLNYIFSMAELHRWHHSMTLEEANTNYGSNIIFWDIVFGTMYYPKDKEASQEIGLSDIEDFPDDYIGQIASPFNWKKLKS